MISHATNIVEHPELVRRADRAIRPLVGRENVIAGTDCGFAQSPMYRRVHPEIMWAKLEALAEGARLPPRNCGADEKSVCQSCGREADALNAEAITTSS